MSSTPPANNSTSGAAAPPPPPSTDGTTPKTKTPEETKAAKDKEWSLILNSQLGPEYIWDDDQDPPSLHSTDDDG